MKHKCLISILIAETFCFILLYLLLAIFYNEFETFSLVLVLIFWLLAIIITTIIYTQSIKNITSKNSPLK